MRWLYKLLFTAKDRVSLYDKLHKYLSDGKPIAAAIDKMLARAKINKNSIRVAVLTDMQLALRRGSTVTKGLSYWSPKSEQMFLQAAELRGALVSGLEQAKDSAIVTSEIVGLMRKMSFTFIGYMCIPFIILYGFYSVFIPLLLQQLPLDLWPATGQGMYNITYLLFHFWPITLVQFVGTIIFYAWAIPNWKSGLREIITRIPLIGTPFQMYQLMQTAMFLKSLSSLMALGTPIDTALQDMTKLAPPWVKKHLLLMRNGLSKGRSETAALSTGFLSKDIQDDLQDYGDMSSFADTMAQIGKTSSKEVIEKITTFTVIILFIGQIMVGSTIALAYVSFLQTNMVAKDYVENH